MVPTVDVLQVVDAEVNVPAWTRCIDSIYGKAIRMAGKPKHALVRPHGRATRS